MGVIRKEYVQKRRTWMSNSPLALVILSNCFGLLRLPQKQQCLWECIATQGTLCCVLNALLWFHGGFPRTSKWFTSNSDTGERLGKNAWDVSRCAVAEDWQWEPVYILLRNEDQQPNWRTVEKSMFAELGRTCWLPPEDLNLYDVLVVFPS